MTNASEKQRIADLKALRTVDNHHIIDKAIENGTSAANAAHKILLERSEATKLTNTVAEAANRNRR